MTVLEEIKKKYLDKIYLVNRPENRLPENYDNLPSPREADYKIAHFKLVSTLLSIGYSDLQESFFRGILDDVSVLAKIQKMLSESNVNRTGLSSDYMIVAQELANYNMVLQAMNVNSLRFSAQDERIFVTFADSLESDYQRYYPHLGATKFGNYPDYNNLVISYLSSYFKCVSAFDIKLSKKTQELLGANSTYEIQNMKTEEDDIFYAEVHNFLLNSLDVLASLNFNYGHCDEQTVSTAIMYMKLLAFLAIMFERELTDSEKMAFSDLIQNSNLVATSMGSYFRKWLIGKAIEFEDSITR